MAALLLCLESGQSRSNPPPARALAPAPRRRAITRRADPLAPAPARPLNRCAISHTRSLARRSVFPHAMPLLSLDAHACAPTPLSALPPLGSSTLVHGAVLTAAPPSRALPTPVAPEAQPADPCSHTQPTRSRALGHCTINGAVAICPSWIIPRGRFDGRREGDTLRAPPQCGRNGGCAHVLGRAVAHAWR